MARCLVYTTYDIVIGCEGVDFVVTHNGVIHPSTGDVCLDTSDLELCVPSEPPDGPVLTTFATRSSAGTTASFAWAFGSNGGTLRTEEIDVQIDYDVVECPAGSCLRMSRLDGSIPDTTVLGLPVTDARLHIRSSAPDGFTLKRTGQFAIAEGDLEVSVFARVAGFSIMFGVPTIAAASGVASPETNVFALRDVSLGFRRLDVSASLDLNVAGTFIARPPTTAIYVVHEPTACSEPVVFRAEAADLDGGSLRHVWMVDGVSEIGGTFERVLQTGIHHVTLTTVDVTGRATGASLNYKRRCV